MAIKKDGAKPKTKQAEESLKESEEKYRLLAENASDIIWTMDMNLRFTYMSPSVTRVRGYTVEEVMAQSLEEVFTPSSVEAAVKVFMEELAIESLEPKDLSRVRTLEVEHTCKDGSTVWVEINASFIRDADGQPVGILGVSREITERRKAEEALRRSEERYRTIMEEIENSYFELDLSGNLTFVNDATCRHLGCSREELVGMNYRVCTPPENFKVVSQTYNQVYRTGAPVECFPRELIKKDGSRMFSETSVFPLRNTKGEIIGFRGVGRDVTERKQAEEALRRSEERYRTILEDIEDSYFELDLSGNLTFVNNAVCRRLGYSREELVGMNYRVFTPPEEVEPGYQAFNEVFLTGKPNKGFSWKFVRKNGSEGFADASVFALRDQEGKIIGFRGVGRDVTERKQAEEKYQTIVRTTIDGFWLADMQGHFLDVNDAYCHLTGYSRDDLLNMAITDVEAIEEPEETAKRIRKIKEVGYDRFETRHRRKDGEIIDVGISVNYLPIDGGRMFVFIRDISERKRAEEAQRRSEERYRTIVEEMDESYYEVDLAGNLTFVNDATCRRLGRSREELIGMKYKAYTPAEDTETVFKIYNRVYRTGEPVKGVPAVAIAKDGSLILVERSVFPLRDEEGKIIGFRGISRDVTDRRKAEGERMQLELKAQVASRLASVGEMAAGVAHEINNPLTGVMGYAQLLMDREEIPSDIRSDLEAINDGARRVAGIVRTLLAFSRQTKPQRKLADINELIESTLVLRAYHLRVNNIEVVTRLVPDVLETVVDPGQIQQVLLNLIVNAEMEMKLAHGNGKLTITTKKSHNTIKICCQDNGPGITPEVIDKIFDPFFTTREVGEGTGLGLSLCYGIVTEHKGKIYAESKPGKGATFIVELPIVTEAKPPKRAEPVLKKLKKTAEARILVVDDEQVVRDVVTRVLTGEGHKVKTVDNAADALKKIESERYDLILLDIKMPGINGVELYKRIQKINKSLAQRVAFITGDIMSADTEKFLSETKVAHIDKPFDAEQLIREVRHALTGGR